MNVSGKLKQLVDYYIPLMPRTYWLDITSICNLRCIMCPQAKGLAKRQAKMPIETFKGIIDGVCENHPQIKLYLSGEPLLHDNLFDMIEYASAKRCQTEIHTNATLLTEEISKRLLSSSLTFITFSFDGCSPEIYEQLRPPAKFEKVKSNIKRYLDLRRKGGGCGPHTTVEIIRMKDTKSQIQEFVGEWKTSGVDSVNITDYMTWLGSVNDSRVENFPNHGYRPCGEPFNHGCILSDGTVVPCCMDVNGKMPLGNINEASFREIWLGDEYSRLRAQMLANSIPMGSICDGCYRTFYQTSTERIVMSVPRFFAFINRTFHRELQQSVLMERGKIKK